MNYYPINLDIRGRPCLVVGGGTVAARKVQSLLACGARVTVVSPQLAPTLQTLAAEGRIAWQPRQYRVDDLTGALIVVAATDQARVNQGVADEARRLKILCNVIDRPLAGDFIVPSVVRRGDLTLTVSTAGQSPALAKHVRKELEARFGNEYEAFLRLLGVVRQRLLSTECDPARQNVFERLVGSDLLAAIGRGQWPAARRQLREILGSAYDDSLLAAAGAPDDAAARQG